MLCKAKRKLLYEQAKCYHKEHGQVYRPETRMSKMARKAGNFRVPVEPKLSLVIRV